MHKIMFFLNQKDDIDLVAVTRSYLNKMYVSYDIEYKDLNIPIYSQVFSRQNLINFAITYWKYNEIIPSSLNGDNLKTLNNCIDVANQINEYDLYCFSSYYNSFFYHVHMALIIKQKYPKAKILFGGPEVMLSETTRRYLTSLDLTWSRGDVDTSVYNILTGKNESNFLQLSKMTNKDVPVYTKQEVTDFLNGNIRLHLSRGCNNHCYYCPTPGMYCNNFNVVKSDIAIGWINNLVDQGARMIFFGDNNLNAYDFDKLLDGMIDIQNEHPIKYSAYLTLKKLTNDQIQKMSSLFPIISPGIECIHPTIGKLMNKKHRPQDEINLINEALNKHNIKIIYQYILGVPGHTEEIVKWELEYLKFLCEKFSNTYFSIYPYMFIAGSYIYENYQDFDCNIFPIVDLSNLQIDSKFKARIEYIFEKDYRINPNPNLDNWITLFENELDRMRLFYRGKHINKNFNIN